MTNTAKLKVTPAIAARLRRGEQVSPEEIEREVRAAEQRQAQGNASSPSDDDTASQSPPARMTRSQMKKKAAQEDKTDSSANEWIPETHLKKGPQGRRKR